MGKENPKYKKEIEEEVIKIDDTLIKMLPQLTANSVVIAKYYKSFYGSLVKEGFTEEQALQIVITRGMNP